MRLSCQNSSCFHYSNKFEARGLLPAVKTPAAGARRPRWVKMSSDGGNQRFQPITDGGGADDEANNKNKKIVVILGATGSGKSRLSIDLASIFPGEVINSDKMQLYSGLDITTNKLPPHQRRDIPHHLLGDVDSLSNPEVSAADYRSLAAASISDISSRLKVPVIAGGSNSFIYALLSRRFDPELNVFDRSTPVSSDLRYRCCFLWVDVSPPVLNEYLEVRVDDMLDSGMFKELAEFFDSEGVDSETRAGLRKAIGVPEFARYFREFPVRAGACAVAEKGMWGRGANLEVGCGDRRREAYGGAVRAIKDNTCQLAKRQLGKIRRLRSAGWDLRRIDATEVFRGVLADSGGSKYDAVWERRVLEPSVEFVKRFLEEE